MPATHIRESGRRFQPELLAGGASAAFLQNLPDSNLSKIGQIALPDAIVCTPFVRPGGESQQNAVAARIGDKRLTQNLRPSGDRPARKQPGQPGQRADLGRPGRPSERPSEIDPPGRLSGREYFQNLPSRIHDRQQWQEWRQIQRDGIRDYVRHNASDEWYGDEWWILNHLQDPYSDHFDYWKPAAWPAISDWVDHSGGEPVTYNYGSNVYYQGGNVYYGDQPVATELEYAEQAEAIARSVPAKSPPAEDWMPLGVFAITSDGEPTENRRVPIQRCFCSSQ